jgi:hypothetical protein
MFKEKSLIPICFVALLIAITLLFIPPLLLLLYVQTRNFLSGKTTIERFGRAACESDRESRILNSGIRGDTQVYREDLTRSISYPTRSDFFD